MKIRYGFVANSSSSSFVIARRKSATKEDVLCDIEKCRDKIREFLEYGDVECSYFGYSKVKELVNEGKLDEAVEEAMSYLAECAMLDRRCTVDFGKWVATSGYLYDGDSGGDYFERFMLDNCGNEDWKSLKSGGCGSY